MQDRDLNQYSPSLSSTSRHLPCSHQLCNPKSSCKGSKDPCPYITRYASYNTSSSGFLIEDKLHLASNSRHGTKNSMQASIILGYVNYCLRLSIIILFCSLSFDMLDKITNHKFDLCQCSR